jgi:hypothetical protein
MITVIRFANLWKRIFGNLPWGSDAVIGCKFENFSAVCVMVRELQDDVGNRNTHWRFKIIRRSYDGIEMGGAPQTVSCEPAKERNAGFRFGGQNPWDTDKTNSVISECVLESNAFLRAPRQNIVWPRRREWRLGDVSALVAVKRQWCNRVNSRLRIQIAIAARDDHGKTMLHWLKRDVWPSSGDLWHQKEVRKCEPNLISIAFHSSVKFQAQSLWCRLQVEWVIVCIVAYEHAFFSVQHALDGDSKASEFVYTFSHVSSVITSGCLRLVIANSLRQNLINLRWPEFHWADTF